MTLLSGKEVIRPFICKASGYMKSLLSAEHVEMNSGYSLQKELDEMNSNLSNRKVLFYDTNTVNPSFVLNGIKEGTTYVYILTTYTALDNTANKQEINCLLNGAQHMGTNGDNAKLQSTFTGLCKKGDTLSVTSYKTAGIFATFLAKLVLIPL